MPPMSDHDTWNMFAAASYAAWLAGGDYTAEECRTRAVADADWFVIESKKRAEAEAAEYKAEMRRVINGEPAEPNPPQSDDDGWIKWDGGECPVPHGTLVSLKFNDGWVVLATHADGWNWKHSSEEDATGNIVAYKRVG